MVKKLSLALFLGLMACSDDSSGTSANIDSGDQINIPISGVSSSLAVSGSSSSADAVSSSQDPVSSSSVKPASSVSSVMSSSAESISSASLAKSSSSEKEIGFINEGWREDCLAKINEYRATENLKPLALASEEKQACVDRQSADDLASNVAHGHFGECGEFAQNSGPNFSTVWGKSASDVAERYLKMMWEDEKALVTSGKRDLEKEEDFPYIGHYKNMRSASYTKVACGIVLNAEGKKGWFNVDFF